MPQFKIEEINATEAAQNLRVEVAPAVGNLAIGRDPSTAIVAHPPVSREEHETLAMDSSISPQLAELLVAAFEEGEEENSKVTFLADGYPSQENVGVAKELAIALMALRGLPSARLLVDMRGEAQDTVLVRRDDTPTAALF